MKFPLLATALALAAAISPLAAQDRAPRPRRAAVTSAEALLGMRARLGLSQDQIDRLSALRREALEERKARISALMDLRSEFRAGEINHDQFAARLSELREAVRARASERAGTLRDVLTAEQRQTLVELRRERLQRERFRWPGRFERWRPGPGPRGGRPWPGPGLRRSPAEPRWLPDQD